MKLYAHPTRPHQQEFYTADTAPAGSYRLQQQLLRAYQEVLFHWWDLDQLLTTCFGPRKGKRLQAAEDRLQYEVPEIIERMTPAELDAAAHVFLHQTLVGFIDHVLQQERSIVWRLKEGNCYTRLCDDSHAKAAGLGKAPTKAKDSTKNPLPARLPTPEPPQPTPLPMLRSARRKHRYNPHHPQQLWIWPPLTLSTDTVTTAL